MGSRSGAGTGRWDADRDGSEVPAELKHEVALLSRPGNGGDEEIRAPELQAACAGDPKHPRAREVIAASVAGLLRCPVCGSVVQRVFPGGDPGRDPARGSGPGDDDGPGRRWHFRRRRGEGECDHEGETVPHREAKTALARALGETLPEGWEVLLEERLENGRRPDVLAVHRGGARVAFEVQYARISRAHWRERRDDYRALGVPDYWLLGAETRWGRSRDDLRKALAEEPGQRVLYVGRFGPTGTGRIEAREVVFSLLDPGAPEELKDFRRRVAPADLGRLTRDEAKRLRVYEIPPKAFPLRGISLRLVGDPGTNPGNREAPRRAEIFTPLDAHNLRRLREGRRRRRERLAQEAAHRARAAQIAAEHERHAERVLAGFDGLEEAWFATEARSRAEARFGPALLDLLETEELVEGGHEDGPPIRAVRRSGWWRVLFYRELSTASPSSPQGSPLGSPFSWEEAAAVFAASRRGDAWVPPSVGAPAWAELRRDLAREGLILPAGNGRWRIPGREARDGGHRDPARTSPPEAEPSPGPLRRLLRRFF